MPGLPRATLMVEQEEDLKAQRFRAAYPLHLGYWSFLCFFFLVGLIEPDFRMVSLCLAPLFLLLAAIRVCVHRLSDHQAAQRIGSLMIATGDSVIWVLAMLIFRSSQIKAGFLVVGLYACCIVVYPIVLAMRAHSSLQVRAVLSVAATTVVASPSWSALTWAEHVVLNLAAFALGIGIAYVIEQIQHVAILDVGSGCSRCTTPCSPPESEDCSFGSLRRHDDDSFCSGCSAPSLDGEQASMQRMRSSALTLHSSAEWATYARVRLIARGVHGDAFLYRCRETGDELVSKEVGLGDELEESDLLAVQNEARVLQNVRHEYIVGFIAALQRPGGGMSILQEYAKGGTAPPVGKRPTALGTLHVAVRAQVDAHQPFGSGVVARWLRQVAQALAHLHSLRVLHRDLSTKNIFLSAPGCDGDVRVGDFGVAKALSLTHSTALTSTMAGTPYYWAPEVLSHEAYGLQADVWSAGVVAFELLTLRRPFVADSLPTLALRVTSAEANGAFAAIDSALFACAHPPALARLATSTHLLHPEPARRLALTDVIEACRACEREARTAGEEAAAVEEGGPSGHTRSDAAGQREDPPSIGSTLDHSAAALPAAPAAALPAAPTAALPIEGAPPIHSRPAPADPRATKSTERSAPKSHETVRRRHPKRVL